MLYRHFVGEIWRDVNVARTRRAGRPLAGDVPTQGLVAGDRVAICLKNGVDWVAMDLAALGMGLVVVPLYVDDNAENVAWCVDNAEARLLIVESSRTAQALRQLDDALPPIVSCADPIRAIRMRRLNSCSHRPAAKSESSDLPADTLATICYTSGTSGRPKGVMLSHGNIIANVTSCQQTGMARPTDTFLSILPLSHMFERTGGYYLPLSIGAKVVLLLAASRRSPRISPSQAPTVMFAVPRIFEKFQCAHRPDAGHGAGEALAVRPMRGARLARRERRCRAGSTRLLAPALRALVAKPILARLGGRLRLTVVGGAALDPGIAHTFIGLGLPMLQGYGMTEASPVISVNRDDDNDPDSVGPPLPGVEVKLCELANCWRAAATSCWATGATTRQRARRSTPSGWLHTGDLAEIRDGKIYIRGRLKDILVMSNGEKLPPQDVEFAMLHDPMFEQVMLVGEGRPFLLLLAVTKEGDEKTLLQRANEQLKAFPALGARAARDRDARTLERRQRIADTDAEAQAPAGPGAVQGRDRRGLRERCEGVIRKTARCRAACAVPEALDTGRNPNVGFKQAFN